MPIFGALLGNWKLLAVIGGVFAFMGLVWMFADQIKTAAKNEFVAQQAQQAEADQETEIARLRRLHAQDQKVISDLVNERTGQVSEVDRLKSQIEKLGDAPVAPAIAETLKQYEKPAAPAKGAAK